MLLAVIGVADGTSDCVSMPGPLFCVITRLESVIGPKVEGYNASNAIGNRKARDNC